MTLTNSWSPVPYNHYMYRPAIKTKMFLIPSHINLNNSTEHKILPRKSLTMDKDRESTNSASLMMDLLFGYAKTEVLFAGVELGVFEALAAGPATLEQLGKQLDIPILHLEKLLNTLTMLGLLKKNISEKEELYENSPTTTMYLTADSKDSLVDMVIFYKEFREVPGKMTEGIKLGKPKSAEESKNVFYRMEKNPEYRAIFARGMACVAKTSHPLVKVFDLGQFKTHIDVGGGTGTFARKVAETYPDLDVNVCDLKRVCDTAQSLPVNKDTRVKWIPDDFFSGDLPHADLYSMCHVLHDWSDDECDVIMKNVFEHVKPGGAILVMDNMFYDDKVGPVRANLTEITQMLQHDGKHRTKAEFEALLTKHGFENPQIYRHPGFGFYDAIFARKPISADPSQ